MEPELKDFSLSKIIFSGIRKKRMSLKGCLISSAALDFITFATANLENLSMT